MVEDGTGEAQVYVYDDLVPTILKLTCQQWLKLQDLAMRNGELLYQRHWRCGNRGPQVRRHLNLPSFFFGIACSQFQTKVFIEQLFHWASITAKAENFVIKE